MGVKKKIVQTIVIIVHFPKVMLPMKKRGFGKGRYNGFGGKKKWWETTKQCARRETKEEGGIGVGKLTKVGELIFEFLETPDVVRETHVYVSYDKFTGELRETEEMKPCWFLVWRPPFKKIWEADKIWFPFMREKRKFRGWFLYGKVKNGKLLKHEIKEVKKFS